MRCVKQKHATTYASVVCTRKTLRRGTLGTHLTPLLVKNLSLQETQLNKVKFDVESLQKEINVDIANLARLEALYKNLNEDINVSGRAAQERCAESETEERLAILNIDLLAATTTTQNSPRIEDTLSNGAKHNFADAQSQQRQPAPQPLARFSVAGEKKSGAGAFRDLQAELEIARIKLSRVDTWQRLEDRGMRLEVKLANGTPVTLSVSRVPGEQLAVRISRSAAKDGAALNTLKSEIMAALQSRGLKIKEITLLEEG